MNRPIHRLLLLLFLLLSVSHPGQAQIQPPYRNVREQAQLAFQEGNYKDAYDLYVTFIYELDVDPTVVSFDFTQAISALVNLNRDEETDEVREKMAAAHPRNWRVLQAVSQSYHYANHSGFMIAGEFQRGQHRGGGKAVHSIERDRIRALQLLEQAMQVIHETRDRSAFPSFYTSFAGALMESRGYGGAWRLSILSDLSELPDYEEGYPYEYYGYWQTGPRGAPVDAEGNPVFPPLPDSWETAGSDGERWRWLLWQAMEVSPDVRPSVMWTFAEFLHEQYGVQTLAEYGHYFHRARSAAPESSGTYELHTLEEDETIARLATGIRRLRLPDEYSFVRIYRELAEDPSSGLREQAMNKLAQLFANRRQYPESARQWRQSIDAFGPGNNRWKQNQLNQIVVNWGQFEPTFTQPAGAGATLDFKFRNGDHVEFSAHRIRVRELLQDVKDYLRSNPSQIDWNRIQISNIGYRLIQEAPSKYVDERVARWSLDLDPEPDHFDKRITVTTPLQDPGAYLLTAQMRDGNRCQIVLWLQDTVLVKKPLAVNLPDDATPSPSMYFVADARTGSPIPGATVEFFGYRQEAREGRWQVRRADVRTVQFAEYSDDDGLVYPKDRDLFPDGNGHQWIVTATADDGRFGYLGFTGMWRANYYDAEYNQTKVYGITDRPVYRPSQSVEWKFWVREAKYDQEDVSRFAGRGFTVKIRDPKGDEIYSESFQADDYGGFDGAFLLPADAALGVYSAYVDGYGGTTFRVEEYKKPEFEVSVDAPSEPVMLGETIEALVTAKYYFGAPVTEARVKYKITRTVHTAQWYPPAPWDWFFGPGYWWFAYDYEWYPGWARWGCIRPWPFWFPVDQTPPEIVGENEVEIAEDGTVRIEIDTSLAKEIHGDKDHRYQITVEVTDPSRRTIVGQGSVLVAREPFKVYAWVDRGYYRVGDVVGAEFAAHTLDQNPVQGAGTLTLYRVDYDSERQPVESPVQTWDLDTDVEGRARIQISASEPGQYRLSYTVTDQKDHAMEGGYVFVVRGEGFDGREFRFNQLELIPDRAQYGAGDEARLMINTEQRQSTVLLFLRPANSVYLKPQVLRLDGKSTVAPISIGKKDMPNFFVEAITVHNGKVYTEVKEIVVPPEKRVLNVEVLPSAEEYRPGEAATVRVKVTDHAGDPFAGTTVLSVYDRSVEYISGGSNVPEIRDFFWKWRRHHSPQTEHNLDWLSGNLTPEGWLAMQPLGIFGATVADEVGRYDMFGALGKMELRAQSGAAPASRMAMASFDDSIVREGMMEADEVAGGRAGGDAAPDAAVEPTVRTEFADTAFWKATLDTDEGGEAEVRFDMPENLTGWKIRTWALGHGTKVGEGTSEVVTTKNLLLRMQAPRFFVEKDEVVLSANIHNYLDEEKAVQAVLELDGNTVEPMDETVRNVRVESGGEVRVDWRVKVVREGEVTVRMKALTDEESDAMQLTFPVFVHGMLKTDSFSGAMHPNQSTAWFDLTVPAERRIDQSRLEVRYSPSLAGAMVDALPYLVEYPYGCTEQTLSRFLPTVLTQKILVDMGIDLDAVREKRTNLNAQEIGDDRERAAQWQRWSRNPVFDQETVNDMVREGLKALYDMQLSDGGWGWFSGYGEYSYPHTTAYVVHGLQIAQTNGVAIVPVVLERGVAWLTEYQEEQVRRIKDPKKYKDHADDLDAFVFMVLVDADVVNRDMLEFLYRDRDHLAVYGKAMTGIAFDRIAETDKRDMLIRNIEQYLVEDEENQTAYLNLQNGGYWWYWYGSEYEAHAYYLKLLARTDPTGTKASGLVKYLLNNRKHATYWNSTRDTAICVEAMAEYLVASREDKPDMTVEVFVDGVRHKRVEINTENLFSFDNRLVLEGEALTSGEHRVELRKTGTGPLYFNAYLTVFTLEDHIERAGLEVKVNRSVYKLIPIDKTVAVSGSRGQAVDQKVEKYERQRLEDESTLTSGDLVEIELEIESKNDYEYLVFEDRKAAGFEPVDLRSGYTGNEMGAYVEFRDERVVFFVRQLARGSHSVSYRMRAEIPGRFSALPTSGHAMYAPELKANSDEIKLIIED